MRFIIQAFFLLFLTSCSLIPNEWYQGGRAFADSRAPARSYTIYPPPPETIYQGQRTISQKNYTLNQTMVAKIGDPVLRVKAFKEDSFTTRELILEKPIKIELDMFDVTLPAKKYPIFGTFELNEQTFFVLPKRRHAYLLVDMEGRLSDRFLYEIKNSDKVTLFNDKLKLPYTETRFKRESYSTQETTPFLDFEVVYDGIKANQISLFYKDAVPSSNGSKGSFDTLTYPKDSTMISLMGRLIRVIRADNEQMTYVVVKE